MGRGGGVGGGEGFGIWGGGGVVVLFTRDTLLRMIYVHRKGRDWLKMQGEGGY